MTKAVNYDKVLKDFRDRYGFSYVDQDMFHKFRFILLTGKAMNTIHARKPDISFYDFICVALKNLGFKTKELMQIAATCECFAYNTYKYPDIHVPDNKIIEELRNIASKWLPF